MLKGALAEWVYLGLAIVLEVAGTTCMKLSQGFTRVWPTVFMVLFYVLTFWALTLSLRRIDVSLAYAIWAGIGTALIAVIGILWFKEPVTALKLGSIGLIIVGVVGLNLSASSH